jgi:hypothetical protein
VNAVINYGVLNSNFIELSPLARDSQAQLEERKMPVKVR